MKISVIIPNYNHASFLEERIESVLQQSFRDFEVIILDDASTDKSEEIIATYTNHPKVSHIVFNAQNSGSPFKQWLKGIELAQGEYMWIAESDDWCEPSLLETLYSPVKSHDNIVLSHCQVLMHTNHNNLSPIYRFEKLYEIKEGLEFCKDHLLYRNDIPNASAVLFKKESFLNVVRKYVEMQYCGDWFIWLKIAAQGNVYSCGKFLAYFRKHTNDVTTKASSAGLLFLEGLPITKMAILEAYATQNDVERAKQYWLKLYSSARKSMSTETSAKVYQMLKDVFDIRGSDFKVNDSLKERRGNFFLNAFTDFFSK